MDEHPATSPDAVVYHWTLLRTTGDIIPARPHDRLALQKLDVGSSTNEGVLSHAAELLKGSERHAILHRCSWASRLFSSVNTN